MGKQTGALSEPLHEFITTQKVFFVGTATADSRVNVSPKGMDSLRVLSNNRVIWLNLTGSGNETSAHVQQDPRMTLAHFANARSVRNALDRARLRQANRLFANASKSLSKIDLMTLEAEDILASRVFLEGKPDLDGDEGSDTAAD